MTANTPEVLSLFDAGGHELAHMARDDLLRMDSGNYTAAWFYEALGKHAGDYWLIGNRPGEQRHVTHYVVSVQPSEKADAYLCWTHRYEAPPVPFYDWEEALADCGKLFLGIPISREVLWRVFVNLYLQPADSAFTLSR